ncbi:MAG: formylglycine-generating enzyme family protein [Candidatus Rokubacteria bacterium]|nr:formylglycine-generating enzyme family protein [Candidatus Rokubacteria bacterium]
MHPQFSKLDGEGQFVFLRGARSIGPRAPDRATGLPTGGPRRVGSLAFRTALDGVEILLGDHRLGEARAGRLLIAENVAAGAQRITARKDGYKAWEREIQVVPNERAEVVIDLEALAAANVIRGDDGAEVLLVPAGEFVMGSTPRESEAFVDACKAWGDREVPKHRVSLDAFHIDRHEVTNALFECFVRATNHRTTAEREGTGWVYALKGSTWEWQKIRGATWQQPNGPGSQARANDPVVQVSWHDAAAYCRWAGRRLPTEAEWEKAARGTDERRFPWGETWEAAKANGDMAMRAFLPVGSYADGASPYGALDMAGNVAEWVADWFGAAYYQQSPAKNPTGPKSGDRRVLRGGSWDDYPVYLRTTFRNESPADYRVNVVGFRCARDAR